MEQVCQTGSVSSKLVLSNATCFLAFGVADPIVDNPGLRCFIVIIWMAEAAKKRGLVVPLRKGDFGNCLPVSQR